MTQDSLAIGMVGYFTSSPRKLADVITLYQQHQLEALQQLRGAFILVIQADQTLTLVRDPGGMRTVFYTVHQGRFAFAVEPKALTALPGFSPRLNAQAVAQYLTFSFVPGQATMIAGIEELLPGHFITWRDGRLSSPQPYFEYEHLEDSYPDREESEWVEQFKTDFSQAVAERIPEKEPIAVYLSGGLDSSVVTAELKQQLTCPVHTFSIHFGEKYPNELVFAREVAAHCKTEHEEVYIRPREFLPRMRKMIWHLDDPIGDPITMPNFELAGYLQQHFRFVFNGEGGDPLFGGPKNIPMLMQHWYGGLPRGEHFREEAYLASYRRGYEELARLLTPEFRQEIDFEAGLVGVLKPFFQAEQPHRFLNKLTVINMRLKGAHLILPKVERMLGAWRLTPLAPLFAESLMQLTMQLPTNLKLRAGVEKWIIKQAYRDALPQAVIDRPKSGMRVPVHFWFQGELRRYAYKILSPKAIKRTGIFDPNRVSQLLRYDTEEGPGRYGLRLWMLITFEIWRRLVLEREPL